MSFPKPTAEQLRNMQENFARMTPEELEKIRAQMESQSSQKQTDRILREAKGQSNNQLNKSASNQRQGRPTVEQLITLPAHISLMPILMEQLIAKVWPLNEKMDPKFRFKDQQAMQSRLHQILFQMNNRVFWLCGSIIQSLLHFDDTQEKPLERVCQPMTVGGLGPGFTALSWCCQWRSSEKQAGWQGKDEIVSLLLAAGADPNSSVCLNSNVPDQTPVCHAAVFGSADTLRMVVEAGGNLNKKFQSGSILKQLLVRPELDKINFVLKHSPDLINEFYYISDRNVNNRHRLTPVDVILNSWFGDVSPKSWILLGTPTLEEVIGSLVALINSGCAITTKGASRHLIQQLMDIVMGVEQAHSGKKDVLKIGQAIIGTWLPERMKKEIDSFDSKKSISSNCGLCHKSCDTMIKPLTLVCGHMFCLQCIMTHAESNSFCPDPHCRRRLCRELDLNPYTPDVDDPSKDYGGPENLTTEQLKIECEAMKMEWDDDSKETLVKKRVPNQKSSSSLSIEIASFNAMGKGKSGKVIWLTPKLGPIWISIKMKGIPIIASTSSWSAYTLVSPAFVELFGLKRTRLSTKHLKRHLSNKVMSGKNTVIEEFEFFVGDVRVTLNNVVEIDPAPSHLGIQLGQDFFRFAAFSKMNILCYSDAPVSTHDGTPSAKNFMVLSEGGYRTGHTNDSTVVEELRYYGQCGTTARIPLHHIRVGINSEAFLAKKIEGTDQTCFWCNRDFHGMLRCTPCLKVGRKVQYCDDKCQKKAWKVHKLSPPHKKIN